MQNFAAQLFQITNLPSQSKDLKVYPKYTAALEKAMDTEFRTFFSSNILAGSGLFSDLFTSRSTVVNQDLAALYGLTGITGTAMQPVTLDANRSGFLTMPAFMTVNGASNDSNGIYRGHGVFMQVLCQRADAAHEREHPGPRSAHAGPDRAPGPGHPRVQPSAPSAATA